MERAESLLRKIKSGCSVEKGLWWVSVEARGLVRTWKKSLEDDMWPDKRTDREGSRFCG